MSAKRQESRLLIAFPNGSRHRRFSLLIRLPLLHDFAWNISLPCDIFVDLSSDADHVLGSPFHYVDLPCCELKFEDERTARLAKIHLDQRAKQSV